MIVLNVPSIIRVLKIPVVSYNQDIAVGAKQLADYLLVSKIKTYSEDIGYYDEKGEENTIIFDKRRLVKTPGYEILITDIDDVIFFEKDAYMYMTITRWKCTIEIPTTNSGITAANNFISHKYS